jgi:hypothetical protein
MLVSNYYFLATPQFEVPQPRPRPIAHPLFPHSANGRFESRETGCETAPTVWQRFNAIMVEILKLRSEEVLSFKKILENSLIFYHNRCLMMNFGNAKYSK